MHCFRSAFISVSVLRIHSVRYFGWLYNDDIDFFNKTEGGEEGRGHGSIAPLPSSCINATDYVDILILYTGITRVFSRTNMFVSYEIGGSKRIIDADHSQNNLWISIA